MIEADGRGRKVEFEDGRIVSVYPIRANEKLGYYIKLFNPENKPEEQHTEFGLYEDSALALIQQLARLMSERDSFNVTD